MNKLSTRDILRNIGLIVLSLVAVIICYYRIIFIKYAADNSATGTEIRSAFLVIAIVAFCWVAVVAFLTVTAENKQVMLLLNIPVDISVTAIIVYWLDHAMTWEFWLYKLALACEVFLLSYLFFITTNKGSWNICNQLKAASRDGTDPLLKYRQFVLFMCCIVINSLIIPREAYVYEKPWIFVFVIILFSSLFCIIYDRKAESIKGSKGYFIFLGFLIIFSHFLIALTLWYSDTFGVSLDEILFTIFSPLNGADTHFLGGAVLAVIPRIAAGTAIFLFLLFLYKKEPEIFPYRIVGIAAISLFVFSF
ncbi:MAG: hypothetical protein IJ873_09670, partial [Lachnospiraceae bacterium]|nr:hypothetical protein [Lachnospiraceae bacterium]